ncbi:ABC transporter permease [Microbacteriaceae bacterium VKM Ac-2855]|nr:ABC transporter permease [Microbacteriaceae bacterium VKM Ac-2855]
MSIVARQTPPNDGALDRAARPRRRGLLDLGAARGPVIAVWIVLALLFVFILIVRPNLAQVSSAQTIVVLAAVTAVAGLGQGTVIFVGGIDLSVPWIMSASAIVFASISRGDDTNALLAFVVALALGAALGAANGLGVTRFGIHPVVMTLAVGAILEGGALGWTGGLVTGSPPPSVSTFMRGDAGSLPLVVPALIVLAVLVSYIYRQTRFGRELQAVGLNPTASRLAGVHSQLVIGSAYAISGVTASVAGIMLSGLAGQSYLGMGEPYLLTSVAVVALGGASFAGGRGHFVGTLGGALLLSALITVLTTFQLPEAVRTITQGVVILVAVIVAKIGVRPRTRKTPTA